MKNKPSFLSILIVTNFISFSIFGQVGDIYLNHYQPQIDGNIIQCNTITQLKDQRLLFGHNYGIKIYDGVRWIDIRTEGSVFSVAYSKKGNIYLGGRGYFGLLKKGNDGIFRFQSLSQNIKNIADIEQVLIAGSKVYFRSKKQIYILKIDTQKVSTIQKKQNQDFSSNLFSFKNSVFIHHKKQGFQEIKGNSLDKITLNNKLNKQRIKVVFRFDSQKLMLGTDEGKLYLFDGKSVQPFKIASQDYITSNVLVDGLSISKTKFALGTLSGGCLIIEKKGGNTDKVINYQTNLPDDEIMSMAKDNNGNLWLGHQAGISKVNLQLPINVYSAYAGIDGKISTVFTSKNQTYVGTSQGLFHLVKVKEGEDVRTYIKKDKETAISTRTVQIIERGKETKIGNLINRTFGKNRQSKINVIQTPTTQQTTITNTKESFIYARQSIPYLYKPIQGISDKIRQIIPFEKGLLVAGNLGLYEVVDKKARKVIREQYINSIATSKKSKNTFYIGSNQGLFIIKRKGNNWEVQKSKIKNESVYSVIEFQGNLWASTMNGVHKFTLNKDTKLEKEYFYKIDNPFGEKVLLRNIDKKVYAFTIKQKYKFTGSKSGFLLEKSKDKSFKIIGLQEKYLWLEQNGKWKNLNNKLLTKPFNTTLLNLFEEIEDIFVDEQNYFWIVSDGQLFKINSQTKNNQNKILSTFLSSIKEANIGYLDLKQFDIPYQKNGFKLNFHLSSPFYFGEKNTMFQYKLKGLNQKWSEWTTNAVIAFNFLPAGNYELELRSKNVFGDISSTAKYSFIIHPPFWQTWWFYFLQTFILGALVFATYHYNQADKSYRVSKILTLVTIITVFEFLFLMIEPSVDEFSGGVPFFKLLMNILLAIFLNPLEKYVHQYFRSRKIKATNKNDLTTH